MKNMNILRVILVAALMCAFIVRQNVEAAIIVALIISLVMED